MKRVPESRKKSVWVAGGANLGIAVIKFLASAASGSSAMMAEGIHSVIDTGNEILLLVGLERSQRPPDREHPFGYGKELYFWSLVVAMMIFLLGGGVSAFEGVKHFLSPHPLRSATWSYVVLGVSFVFESISWWYSYKELKQEKGDLGIFSGVQESKDPAIFTILFEDTAALAGLVIAALGIALTQLTGNPRFDAGASVAVGLLLGLAAVFLANECRHLLIGESLLPEKVNEICEEVQKEPNVVRVIDLLSMHLGPREVLLNLRLELKRGLGAEELVSTLNRVESRIRRRNPEVARVFIDAETFLSIGPAPVEQRPA